MMANGIQARKITRSARSGVGSPLDRKPEQQENMGIMNDSKKDATPGCHQVSHRYSVPRYTIRCLAITNVSSQKRALSIQ